MMDDEKKTIKGEGRKEGVRGQDGREEKAIRNIQTNKRRQQHNNSTLLENEH